MKILSWNVRGLGKKEKLGKLKQLIKQRKMDVLLILETKQKTRTKNFIYSIWGDSECDYAEVDANGTAWGLLRIWSTEVFSMEAMCSNKNFIMVKSTIMEWGLVLAAVMCS